MVDDRTKTSARITRRVAVAGGVGLAATVVARRTLAQGVPAAAPAPVAARLLLVFTTDSNSTRQMADAVAAGARSVTGTEVTVRLLKTGREVKPEQLERFDALILGTPVRHRSMHHRVKKFVEHALEAAWLSDGTVGMVGGAFVVGGGHGDAGAGAELCMAGVLAGMAANGMVLVPLPKCTPGFDHAGLHWGPVGRTGGPKMEPVWLTKDMTDAGFHHGANVARVAAALKPTRATLFARGNQSPDAGLLKAFTAGPTNPLDDDAVPEPGENPFGRGETKPGYPSGDGFEVRR